MKKGTVEAGAAVTSQYTLSLPLIGDINATEIGAIKREVELADMPDRTRQSTGNEKPIDTTIKTLIHHTEEMLAMEALYLATRTGTAGYKVEGTTLSLNGADEVKVRGYLLLGFIIHGMEIPDLKAGDQGSPVEVTWSVSLDGVEPLS